MSTLDPVDIASLMEQEPVHGHLDFVGGPFEFGGMPLEFDTSPFELEDEGARAAGKPRCGVCLFPLGPGARSSNVDVDEDLYPIKHTMAKSTLREFQVSAARGCTFCDSILNFALGRGAVQVKFKQASHWRGVVISRENGTFENFLLLAPPNKSHEELNNQEFNFVCRGLGAASIKGTAEDEVLDKARLWWDRCTREHHCRPQPCSYIPHRLLRIDHRPDETATVVWLVEDLTAPVEYVALSHRWSEETKAVSLVNSNRRQRMEKGVLSSNLPRLIQDTIHVLRRFRIEYLWIDCMCIIQGDSADWKHEASSMASIYKNATFTISAIHCNGSSESLFSDPNRIIPGALVGELSGGTPVHLEQHLPHPFRYHHGSADSHLEFFDHLMDSKLNLLSRGWVYQEVLLSPRTLFFLANEVMWRCREYTVCQCARYDFNEGLYENSGLKAITDSAGTLYYSGRGSQQIASRGWANIVEVYSSKDLTFPKDRLPALAGIAEEYGNATGREYICGLWWEDMKQSFGWSRNHTTSRARRPDNSLPTWSWASIETEVMLHDSEGVEFESCHITYNNQGNPYLGDVKEAVLNVRGDAFPAKLVPPSHFDQYNKISKYSYHGGWGVSVLSFISELEQDCDLTETSTLVNADVLCLILCVHVDIDRDRDRDLDFDLDLNGDLDEALDAYFDGVFDEDGDGDGHFECLVLRGVDDLASRYERLGRVKFNGDKLQSGWKTQWNVSKKRLALV